MFYAAHISCCILHLFYIEGLGILGLYFEGLGILDTYLLSMIDSFPAERMFRF